MAEPAPAKAHAMPQVVHITGGNTKDDVPSVDLQPVRVPSGGRIRWLLSRGKSFRVLFVGPQGTPFGSQYEFSGVDDEKGAESPEATVTASKTKLYKYVVSVDGGRPLDPDVIVDP
jgi:hypothetical protein